MRSTPLPHRHAWAPAMELDHFGGNDWTPEEDSPSPGIKTQNSHQAWTIPAAQKPTWGRWLKRKRKKMVAAQL